MPVRLLAFAASLALLLLTAPARATYTEWHVTGSDERVAIERDGQTRVTHRVSVHVVAGSMRVLELSGYPADAIFDDAGSVASDDGRKFALSVGRDGDTMVSAAAQDALGRGDYTFELSYRVDARPRLTSDGALSLLTLASPPLSDGVDGLRVVVDLPTAATEPRLAGDGAGVLATLRTSADRDELELVRPHVPRGEVVQWRVRVDPSALSAKLPAPARVDPTGPAFRPTARDSVCVGVGLFFAALVLLKRRTFERMCEGAGARVLALPGWLAALSSGSLAGLAAWARTAGKPAIAGALVAAAMAAATLRARVKATPRGPGRWMPLRAKDAFAPTSGGGLWPAGRPGDALDARSARGRRVGAVALVATVIVSVVMMRTGAPAPDAPLLLSLLLVPIFLSGTRHELSPDASRCARALSGAFRRLGRLGELKVLPWARLPALATGDEADELRVLVMPRAPMPGLRAVELAVAWSGRGASRLPLLEVLVRVDDESAAAGKLRAGFLEPIELLPGRVPDERVYRFLPEWPTDACAASLAHDLARGLRDRRVRGACIWEGADRRAAVVPTSRAA